MLAVKEGWSSRVTPRFLVFRATDTTEFSILMDDG